MCLAILKYQCSAAHPVILGANREEVYDRRAQSPSWIDTEVPVFAGRDLRAGGTWLAVKRHGVLAAVTNRRTEAGLLFQSPAPGLRSRGLLCLDVLQQETAGAARAWVLHQLGRLRYSPFNLLIAARAGAFAVHGVGVPEVVELSAGVHVLTDTDVDDLADARVARALALVVESEARDWPQEKEHLQAVMADHDERVPPQVRMCRHGRRSGTVSSSLVALSASGPEAGRFLYAPGPPCTHPYQDLSAALQQSPPQSPGH